MPYIRQQLREHVGPELGQLICRVVELSWRDIPGVLNYCISTLVYRVIKARTGWSYENRATAHEVFNAAGAEFYRRVLAPYEDLKTKEHGDIYE